MPQKAPYDDDEEEREDRFFISGVDNAGVKRDQYRTAVLKRKIYIGVAIGVGVATVVGLFLGLFFGLRGEKHLQYECPNQDFATSPDLIFFVIGDWGRGGIPTQRRAANVMQQVADNCLLPAFVISTGDNFYEDGLRSATDAQFIQSFVNVYTDDALQVPWYAVLGNHDYGLEVAANEFSLTTNACLKGLSTGCYSPLWELDSNVLLNKLDQHGRWHCQQGAVLRSFLGGQVDILFIDTNAFIARYRTQAGAALQGGVAKLDAEAQLAEIESLLANSDAPWRLVVGHHPVYSFGEHCVNGSKDCEDMQKALSRLLKQYKVHAYLNGHEHDLQLIRMPDDLTTYVTSGAGSNVRYGEFDRVDTSDTAEAFLLDDQGFVAAVIRGVDLTLYFYASNSRGVAFEVTIHQ